MDVVVYSRELEPITVLDLKMEVMDSLREHHKCILKTPEGIECRLFAIFLPWVSEEGTPSHIMMVLTIDDEQALQLNPGWLPGQRSAVNMAVRGIRRLKAELMKYMRGED